MATSNEGLGEIGLSRLPMLIEVVVRPSMVVRESTESGVRIVEQRADPLDDLFRLQLRLGGGELFEPEWGPHPWGWLPEEA